MRFAYATFITLVLWLTATLYWTNSHGVHSHTLYACFSPTHNIQTDPQLNLWNGVVVGVINFAISPQKLCHLLKNCTCNRMSSSAKAAATPRKLFEENDNMDIVLNGKKRSVGVMIVSSQKKAKGKETAPQRPPFWLGYHTLNALARYNGEMFEPTLSVSELVRFGMEHNEALEHLEAFPSFPYVPQEAWPSKRLNGKEGGHFNLTQVPFDVEIDKYGFSLDYQIAIAFELGD